MRTGRLAGAAAAALAAAISLQAGHGQAPDQYGAATPADLSSLAPASAARSLDELAARFDQRAAIDLVRFMDGYWREAANAGFNATLDRIKARLEASGFAPADTAPAGAPTVRVESFGRANGWNHTVGTLALAAEGERPEEILLSRERHRVALCINSFSTPPGGIVAPVVDVGEGASDADYEGRDVRGAVVLGDSGAFRLWQAAVVRRGAIGIVSTALDGYIEPGPSAADRAKPRREWDVLQWGSVPYDETRRGFGFKATPRAAALIRERLKAGPARVRVEVASTFTPGPIRTLVAEIPGAIAPQERVVMVAHVQEPGANDNASGCASLQELARAIAAGMRQRTIAAPGRTLTFLWGDEIRASRQWIVDHPVEAKQVRYMIALDMTGEDVTKTGGSFLIEKAPDPAAVWDRPSDPHTDWGGGHVKAGSLRGTLLNDLFLAICQVRAQRTGWVVRTNPYEGGSDHTPFVASGVPALLAWHFPDRFYHTNLDRPEMTSPSEMEHVAVSAGAAALLLAGASATEARQVVALLEHAARERLALERRQGAALVRAAPDRAAAEATEAEVMAAWLTWYAEAVRSVADLPPGGADAALARRIDEAVTRLGGRGASKPG
ncbi:MAG TPA: M28 family peptidase [Vicinamibacterales bacterium]|nr:M28 family peptidase [Vicinamibacterales bacterium]HOQ59504.1 M28 family peptidase [Vicinamibacterales bacterium]